MVEVGYLPSRVTFEHIVDIAKARGCTDRVFTTTDAQQEVARSRVGDAAVPMVGEVRPSKESDQLYYLKRSHLKHLTLSPLQARRVNGALGTKQDPDIWLSPRQQALGERVQRALKKDPKRFDGLTRPTQLTKMAPYEEQVLNRL